MPVAAIRLTLATVARALLPVVLVGSLLAPGPAATAATLANSASVDVEGDDDADAFIGRGGLLLPPSVDTGTRREVAACPGCRWRLTSACVDTELGNAFDGQQSCLRSPGDCPAGQLRRAWYDPGAGTWANLGLVCVGDRVRTVATMGREVRTILREQLDALSIQTVPHTRIVTQMPAFFSSGRAPGPLVMERNLGGHQVRVTASAAWDWDFGDGAHGSVDRLGTLRSGTDTAHTYRRPGVWQVRCRAVWTAQFTVDGLGPFPVAESVRQQAHREVHVGEGRALLVP